MPPAVRPPPRHACARDDRAATATTSCSAATAATSIHAGPWGDVIWGDYKPSGQPTRQHDQIWGGPGRDHIYASHGRNAIRAGGGNDWIKAHFGGGLVNCGAGNDLLYISRRAQKHYKIRNCERISHKTLGR